MVWILAIAFVGIILIIAFFIATRNGTLYIHNPTGYIGISGGEKPLRKITLEQCRALIPHVMRAEVIDFLWVSADGDRYEGISLFQDEGKLEFSLNYGPKADRKEIESFKGYLQHKGCSVTQEDISSETSSIEFELPANEEFAFHACMMGLHQLPAEVGDDLFADADLIKEGVGSGIHFKRERDRIAELL